MAHRIVRCGLIQAKWEGTIDAMVEKHIRMTDEAAEKGVQIICYQEVFNTPWDIVFYKKIFNSFW